MEKAKILCNDMAKSHLENDLNVDMIVSTDWLYNLMQRNVLSLRRKILYRKLVQFVLQVRRLSLK